jgi:hypothetical protein
MAQLPWKAFSRANPDRDYVALVTYLPLRTLWALPHFLYYTRRIREQLESARGLIGYSLVAHIVAKRFWTLSVWENEVALMEFVHKRPHNESMVALRRFMGGTAFSRWTVKGSAVPPSWAEAMERSGKGESDG